LLPDLSLSLGVDRGVFSRGGIDMGTRLLLLESPAPDPGVEHVLDLGCGYGPIAMALAHRAPDATVWAVDVNPRAIGLCAANAAAAGFAERVRAVQPDAVPPDVRFDLIWSNPPIRIGKVALHQLLTTWLERLTPGGRAVLVTQRHLGADSLTDWLNAQGWPTNRMLSRRGYRLLDVRARTATP